MKTLAMIALGLALATPTAHEAAKPFRIAQASGMCIKTREEMAGPYKICHYDCGGRDVTITVRNIESCPAYIQ